MAVYLEALLYRYEVHEMCQFGIKNLYNEEYDDICSENINKTVKRWIITIGIILTSIILASIYPIYIWYRDGVFYTLAGALIPFVEQNSYLNITINLIFQALLGYSAINGLTQIQVAQGMILNSIEISTDISMREMKNLSTHLEGDNADEAVTQEYMTKIFRQIHRIDR